MRSKNPRLSWPSVVRSDPQEPEKSVLTWVEPFADGPMTRNGRVSGLSRHLLVGIPASKSIRTADHETKGAAIVFKLVAALA